MSACRSRAARIDPALEIPMVARLRRMCCAAVPCMLGACTGDFHESKYGRQMVPRDVFADNSKTDPFDEDRQAARRLNMPRGC